MTFRTEADLFTKEEHVKNFIKSFQAIEDAISPYQEQRRDLRKEYDENSWLTKQEMRTAVKAYRLMKSEVDMDEFLEYFDNIRTTVKEE
tara:strand:- start:1285 stop:1551 length:267 start_codon:yes stop_codon:yes gene_type:complete